MTSAARLRRATAAVGTALILLAGAGNPTVWADPGDQGSIDGTSQEASNPAVINPDATVRLSITKYLGAPTGPTADGTRLGTAPALPTLSGVRFDVHRLYADSGRSTPVDLTSSAGWAAASALGGHRLTTADFAAGSFTSGGTTYYLGDPTTVTTGAGGTAAFTQVNGVGVYAVRENIALSDTIGSSAGGTVPASDITPSAPFIVTLPMTDPAARNRWMYDVYVYPKNQQDRIRLTVQDEGVVSTEDGTSYGAGADHDYTYTLESSITNGSAPLGVYVLYDDLHDSVIFTGATVSLSGGTTLTAGTDYDVYTAPGWGQNATLHTGGAVTGGPVVTIVFTDTGLGKLEGARGQDVVTQLRVTAGPRDTDGMVENTASSVPNEAWWNQYGSADVNPENPASGLPGNPVGIVSNEVLSAYGDLIIDKFDAQTDVELAGATFGIYTDPNADGQCTSTEAVPGNLIGATPATDSEGATRFAGLHTSDFYDGGTQSAVTTYCLAETTAPNEYELDARPRAFTVERAADGTLSSTTVRVSNVKANLGNELPLTGGPGVALLSLVGALLIGAGLGYYVLEKRRR